MVKVSGTLAIFGVLAYVFAVLAQWSYHGGPASWSPKYWRGQKMLGLALIGSAAMVLLLKLAFR